MSGSEFLIRNTELEDIEQILEISDEAYPKSGGWGQSQIRSQIEAFPEGQFVVIESGSGRVVGMAASLIIRDEDYPLDAKWKDITEWGHFGTHDPARGKTLYGAEIMVRPTHQGQGVGKLLYRSREALVRSRGLLNIKAGARISGYYRHAQQMSPREYTLRVVRGELTDPTLSFQLKRGFRVLGITPRYFYDPESLHYAAVIEWLNPEVASPADWAKGDPELTQREPRGPVASGN